jgi:hypothetical protein
MHCVGLRECVYMDFAFLCFVALPHLMSGLTEELKKQSRKHSPGEMEKGEKIMCIFLYSTWAC